MSAKLNPLTAAPALMKEWHRTSTLIASTLEPDLSELVKIRASQINGCANCLNMHTVFARETAKLSSASISCQHGAASLPWKPMGSFRPPRSKSKTEKSRQFTWSETLTS
jgi:AhpD family alkylhydroperoxidase